MKRMHVVGKRVSNAKCIFARHWKWNEIKLRVEAKKQSTNYKVTAEEQSLAFPLLTIVRWYERITLVCAWKPPGHTHARTHVFPSLLLLIFAFCYCYAQQLLWCVYFVYVYFCACAFTSNGEWLCSRCKNAYYNLWVQNVRHISFEGSNNKTQALLISSFCFFL